MSRLYHTLGTILRVLAGQRHGPVKSFAEEVEGTGITARVEGGMRSGSPVC